MTNHQWIKRKFTIFSLDIQTFRRRKRDRRCFSKGALNDGLISLYFVFIKKTAPSRKRHRSSPHTLRTPVIFLEISGIKPRYFSFFFKETAPSPRTSEQSTHYENTRYIFKIPFDSFFQLLEMRGGRR